jgi:hypothetical protein
MSEKYSSGVTPEPSDTERQLLVKILIALNYGAASGGENIPVIYTSNPNSEGLTPINQNLPAVAYSSNGQGSIYGWNTTQQIWQ